MATEDEIRLAKLGYKQEFKRGFKFIHNFGVSFTIVSIIIGVNTLLSYALVAGGSAGAIIGWLVVSALVLCVAYSLTEICSAMPTAGGLYYWAAKLGGDNWGPFFAWYTAWIGIIGGVSGSISVAFSISQFTWSLVLVWHPEVEVTLVKLAALAEAALLLAAILNSLHDQVIAKIVELSVYSHIFGTFFIGILVLVKAPKLQSASFVFQQFENLTGQDSMGFAVLLGLLFPSWTFLGFDASAHIAEETVDSHIHAARGISSSVTIAVVIGFFLTISVLFSIQDVQSILTSPYPQTITQLYMDVAGPVWTTVILIIVLICSCCCLVCSVTANSRVVYAWSRDRGFGTTLSQYFYYAHPTSRLPLRAVWLVVFASMALACIGFGSNVALSAFSSVATIGYMVSYVIPIFSKAVVARDSFKPGPINMGRLSPIVNWISIAWVTCITLLFSLPSTYPVTGTNLNYAPILVVFYIGVITVAWFVSAKNWFHGPVSHISDEELADLEKVNATKDVSA
ncbi:amino acid transporter [Gonapodya prolifera JEL478]|uniref:Amino acid transporter n=1 Tax=Gonapodya prolifera (strain JEL478) TaxID=1344416 RepID=A0A139AMK8_GONPJ|nr:amino acid transporter [Gonapodya prolifera JEL478]|eukprot:KXS17804.1 amino acid transporter [Gonapodya prolifera JEL478]